MLPHSRLHLGTSIDAHFSQMALMSAGAVSDVLDAMSALRDAGEQLPVYASQWYSEGYCTFIDCCSGSARAHNVTQRLEDSLCAKHVATMLVVDAGGSSVDSAMSSCHALRLFKHFHCHCSLPNTFEACSTALLCQHAVAIHLSCPLCSEVRSEDNVLT